jgi:hypothetical protein
MTEGENQSNSRKDRLYRAIVAQLVPEGAVRDEYGFVQLISKPSRDSLSGSEIADLSPHMINELLQDLQRDRLYRYKRDGSHYWSWYIKLAPEPDLSEAEPPLLDQPTTQEEIISLVGTVNTGLAMISDALNKLVPLIGDELREKEELRETLALYEQQRADAVKALSSLA